MFDLKNLNDEYFSNLASEEVLEIKGLSTEEKAECFKYFLSTDVISNVSVISNVFILVNGITNIDDDLMDDDRIFFNSLEEYIDIKLEIKHELDVFNTKLVEYYLGVIQGIDVKLDELKTHIPNTYFNVMPLITPNLISKLMLKYLPHVNVENVKPAFCAIDIYNKIHNPDNLITGFLQSLASEVELGEVNNSGAM